jgi:hypothetical protein
MRLTKSEMNLESLESSSVYDGAMIGDFLLFQANTNIPHEQSVPLIQEVVRRCNEYPTLKQQRDDLLEACKRMLGAMACDELNNGRVFDDDLRKEVKEQAKAAIAKCEKG